MSASVPVEVRVRVIEGRPELPLPSYATPGSAGMDLPAAESLFLHPGSRAAVRTGLAFALPDGYEAQVRPRSGLAFRHGITVLNSPGTIDCDYRGEVKVLLINHGDVGFRIEVGSRIAQLVVAPVSTVRLQPVPMLDDTQRGQGGFGHSG